LKLTPTYSDIAGPWDVNILELTHQLRFQHLPNLPTINASLSPTGIPIVLDLCQSSLVENKIALPLVINVFCCREPFLGISGLGFDKDGRQRCRGVDERREEVGFGRAQTVFRVAIEDFWQWQFWLRFGNGDGSAGVGAGAGGGFRC
jgi:hypothetical protein